MRLLLEQHCLLGNYWMFSCRWLFGDGACCVLPNECDSFDGQHQIRKGHEIGRTEMGREQ